MSRFGGHKTSGSIQWLHDITTVFPLLPSLIAYVGPSWSLPPFTPRQFIYSNDLIPFLFAPWSTAASFSTLLSRGFQVFLFWRLPEVSVLYCYPLWILIALLRMITGYVLSRSVGWAYPSLFRHWALYETSGGFGPPIVAYLLLFGGTEILKKNFVPNLKGRELQAVVGICALLSWLDDAPWTYGVAIILGATCALGHGLLNTSIKRTAHPLMLDGQKSRPALRKQTLMGSVMLSLFAISLPHGLYRLTGTSAPPEMPPSPSHNSPLLEILILSHPRPNVTAATAIMKTTLNSYLPFLSPNVALSAFTHSTDHQAFMNARDTFKNTNIDFFVDSDSHPDAISGQYLHLAEAFRWTSEKQASQAEWIMLVEDDFPLCGGEAGWNVVKNVMGVLEHNRVDSKQTSRKLGGFVGTGGSGLIIHHTLLPILILLMNTHAEISSKISPNATRRPADLVIQDCLLGADPLCPRQESGGGGLVITSRLIMDHIGGMATTNKYKAYNEDKWRCGWRHPFHGRPEVEVVVV
ncbi:hypothetical protein BDZ94DRAFT_654746 [Collybia nuda]|uniref:Uncharacterized protein n=1 Tax=Collybia nuda TaxID=64659 RepID=A0A9P6CI21_9AGAR|nr:hypothetical protein BDZ94DRAFT_654746 [Collybia nuda]